jgi:hypothetical protein
VPPEHAPDGPYGLGWKYIFLGLVDLEKGEINECPYESLSAIAST